MKWRTAHKKRNRRLYNHSTINRITRYYINPKRLAEIVFKTPPVKAIVMMDK